MRKDRAIECMLAIRDRAEAMGAVVDRVEVSLHQGGKLVAFTAYVSPKPLAVTGFVESYEVGE